MNTSQDHYQILGIPRSAGKKELKRAYRALAMRLPPDRDPGNPKAEAQFKQVNLAYEILKDDKKRLRYDLLNPGLAAVAQPHAAETPLPRTHAPSGPYADILNDPAKSHTIQQEPGFDFKKDMLRYVFIALLALLATASIFGKYILSLPFVFGFMPVAGLLAYHFREDILYFICILSARHLIQIWLVVLILAFGTSHGSTYALMHAARASSFPSSGASILAPFRLIFFLYYLMFETFWSKLLFSLIVLWAASLCYKPIHFSAWIFFSLLLAITLITKSDTQRMSEFILYYNNLFSISPINAPS